VALCYFAAVIFEVFMKQFLVVVSTLFLFGSIVGCYNTYRVTQVEFAKLQQAPAGNAQVQTVTDQAGTEVAVAESTGIYVRSRGGRRYPVTPFNFQMSQSQLVASDRDTLLRMDELVSYEVDHLSTWKTALLVSGGVLALAGVITAVIVTADTDTYD
jgi:hypothetical protein